MLGRYLRLIAIVGLIGGCAAAGRTFEPGVEYLPGPVSFVVMVEPPAAADASVIEFTEYDGDVLTTFHARRGESRFVVGTTFPSVLRARVDAIACTGEIDLAGEIEADATLTIDDATGCHLRLDLLHGPDAIDHRLEDVP